MLTERLGYIPTSLDTWMRDNLPQQPGQAELVAESAGSAASTNKAALARTASPPKPPPEASSEG